MTRAVALIAALLAALAFPAVAETFGKAGDGSKASEGSVLLCHTTGQLYLPCDATTPLAISGTFSAGASTTSGTVAPGTAAAQSNLVGGVFNTSLPTLTNGQQAAMQFDAAGRLIISIGAGNLTLGALPTGANTIGAVTQAGTWNVGTVTTLPALPTGANTIGAVTQAGTWNVGTVTTLPALPTGSNVIGSIANTSFAATQSGAWNVGTVTTLPALVAGAAVIGKVGIDHTTPGTTDSVVTSPGLRTLVTLDVATVTTSGVAVTAVATGNRTAGGWIYNPGVATINLCINEIGTASGTTSAGNTTCIFPGQTYTLTPAAGAVSVISSDSAHPFSGMGWK